MVARDGSNSKLWTTIEKFAILPFRWIILGGMLLLNQGVNFGLFDGLITRIYGTSLMLQIYTITFTPILQGVLLAYLLHGRRSFEALYRVLGYRWSSFVFLALLIATIALTPEPSRGSARLALTNASREPTKDSS
jgi:hypothetical protein